MSLSQCKPMGKMLFLGQMASLDELCQIGFKVVSAGLKGKTGVGKVNDMPSVFVSNYCPCILEQGTCTWMYWC